MSVNIQTSTGLRKISGESLSSEKLSPIIGIEKGVGENSIQQHNTEAQALGTNSLAFGNHAKANGDHSIALGSESQTAGLHTYAIGYGLKTKQPEIGNVQKEQVVVGSFNELVDAKPEDNSTSGARFVVGVGTSDSDRSNGLVVYGNGTVRLGADPEDDMDAVTKKYAVSQFYTKSDVDTKIDGVQTELSNKADKEHEHSYNDLTDLPTIPSIEGLATTNYVDESIADLVDSAPAALNTLGELAEALNEHEGIYEALLNEVGKKSPIEHDHDGDYLRYIPAEYVTEDELSNKNYVTATEVEKLSDEVAYLDLTDNGNIEAGTEEVSALITNIDSSLSKTSTNPVQNKAIATEVDALSSSISSINNILSNTANAIVLDRSGTHIQLSDSTNQPLHGLKVYGKTTQFSTSGKNLLNPSVLDSASGITKADGVYSGTINSVSEATKNKELVADGGFEEGTQYVFSLYGKKDSTAASSATPYIIIHHTDGTSAPVVAICGIQSNVFRLVYTVSVAGKTVDRVQITYGSGGTSIVHIKDIQIAKGTAFTGYEPYTGGIPSPNPDYPQEITSIGDKGEVNVRITGKNLFGGDALADKLVELSKATKDEEAGTAYVLAYNASGDVYFNDFKPDTRYTFIFRVSVSPAGIPPFTVKYTDGTTARLTGTAVSNKTIVYTSTVGKTIEAFQGANLAHATVYYTESGIFEGVLTADDFEPYKSAQTITIATPNGLGGIRFNNIAANHTDINGNLWRCDILDLEKGVIYGEKKTIVLTGDEDISATTVYGDSGNVYAFPLRDEWRIGLCSHYIPCKNNSEIGVVNNTVYLSGTAWAVFTDTRFTDDVEGFKSWLAEQYAAGTPVTLMGMSKTTAETPLTEEELTSYRTAHTNKPNTKIYSDDGAELAIEYAADTKLYIDNKFAELSAALLNN